MIVSSQNAHNSNFTPKLGRFNSHFTTLTSRKNRFIFSTAPLNAIDNITINTNNFKYPDLNDAFNNLLSHRFQKADINDKEVIKGNIKINKELTLQIHEPSWIKAVRAAQIIVPHQLSQLLIFSEAKPPDSTILPNVTGNATFDIQEINNYKPAKELIEFIKQSIENLKNQISKINLPVLVKNISRNRIPLETIKNHILNVLNDYLNNIEKYHYWDQLSQRNYYFQIGRTRTKAIPVTTIITYLLFINNNTMPIVQSENTVRPIFLVDRLSRYYKIAITKSTMLGTSKILPTFTIMYPII